MDKQHYVAIAEDGSLYGVILGAREKEVKSNLRAAIASRYGVHTSHIKFISFEEHGSDYRAMVRLSEDIVDVPRDEEIHLALTTVYG